MWYVVCSLSPVLLFPATETLSEVPALRAAGVEKGDIKVSPPRTWSWSPSAPWPPVECVKAAGLWTLPKFSEIRSRLLKAAAHITVDVGSDFVALQMVASGAGSQVNEDPFVGSQRPTVCDCEVGMEKKVSLQ